MPDGGVPFLPDHVSACPSCGTSIPIPVEAGPAPITVSHGRMAGGGCYAELSERRFVPHLELATSTRTIYRGREPGRWLTIKGAVLLFAGPPVIVALAISFDLLGKGDYTLPAVIVLLALATIAYAVVGMTWKSRRSIIDRTLDHAWALLVPRLHSGRFSTDDSSFVAGLALHSIQVGAAVRVRQHLPSAISATEQAVTEGRPAIRHLADLQRLIISEAKATGKDAVALVAAQLGRCFEGRFPPVYAEELFADSGQIAWNEADFARLRLLVIDRAFEAGCEVGNLIEAGQIAPMFANLLQTDDRDELARLRYLWSLRAQRPWDQYGLAETAYELSRSPEGALKLEEYPDLLLYQVVPLAKPRPGQSGQEMRRAEIVLCGSGVLFQNALFRAAPERVDVISRGPLRRGGHKLVIGENTFVLPEDPTPLARALERWFKYHFNEFLPKAREALEWQSPAGDAILRRWGTVACPKCQRIIRTRPGQVGVVVGDQG